MESVSGNRGEKESAELQGTVTGGVSNKSDSQIETNSKRSKKHIVKEKIESTKARVDRIDIEMNKAIMNLSGKISDILERVDENLLPVLKESKRVLGAVDRKDIPEIKIAFAKQYLENGRSENMNIDDLPAGHGMAVMVAICTFLTLMLIWYYLGTSGASMPLVPDKIPDMVMLKTISAHIADIFGLGLNATAGAAIVSITTLLAGWAGYLSVILVKASANLKKANEIEMEADRYLEMKSDELEKLDEISKHFDKIDSLIAKYTVLLDENNAILRRSLFLEGVDDFSKLHGKTQETVRDTIRLMRGLRSVLETPLIDDKNSLSSVALDAIKKSENELGHYIEKLYR